MINKMLMMSLMTVITVVSFSKVVVPFLAEDASESQLMQQQVALVEEVNSAEVQNVDQFAWKAEWLADELIPSAEAAVGMRLDEEADSRSADAAKVIELREKQQQLNEREKSLNEREIEIKAAEVRAQDKITELEQLEARIQVILNEEKSIKDKKIKRLTAVYEGMKAEKAAPVIASMDLEIVVKIFSRMSEKQVGKILSFLPPQKAVTISQALTKRIATISK